MDYRVLFGGNLFRWFDKQKNVCIQVLLFYEKEKWNPLANAYAFDLLDSSIFTKSFRMNLSSKFVVKLNEFVDFAGLIFEFPLNQNFLNPRWFLICL